MATDAPDFDPSWVAYSHDIHGFVVMLDLVEELQERKDELARTFPRGQAARDLIASHCAGHGHRFVQQIMSRIRAERREARRGNA